MLLPVFSILITPALAILASAFEIVPAFISILLKIVVSLLAVRCSLIPCLVSAIHALLPLIVAVLRPLTPIRSLLRPSRTFAQSRTFCREVRRAIGDCSADRRAPAAAPEASPKKFPTSPALGRCPGCAPGRPADPSPGLAGSCDGPPGRLAGRSAVAGRSGFCEGRSAVAGPGRVSGRLGSCDGRSEASGRTGFW